MMEKIRSKKFKTSTVIFRCAKCGEIRSKQEEYVAIQKMHPVNMVCQECERK